MWTDSLTSANLNNLNSGIYELEITDENNCTAEALFEVESPNELIVESEIIPQTSTDQNGSIKLFIDGGTSPYNLTWDHNALGTFLTDLASGTYFYSVIDANDCTLRDSIILEAITSTSTQNTISGVTLFPNPTDRDLHINTLLTHKNINLVLHNAIGQVVYQEQHNTFAAGNHSIDVGQLPAGLYYLSLSNAESKGLYKIVVEHP